MCVCVCVCVSLYCFCRFHLLTLYLSISSLSLLTQTLDLSDEVSRWLNGFHAMPWFPMVIVSLLNATITMLMVGVRAARRSKYKPNRKLIYNYIGMSVFAVFITLLWVSVAVFSYILNLNLNFCGENPNESLLDLLAEAGYEYSAFFAFTQNYIEVWIGLGYLLVLGVSLYIYSHLHFL